MSLESIIWEYKINDQVYTSLRFMKRNNQYKLSQAFNQTDE